ncbi:hypothetical protein, partial [Sporisorium scitamineum]
AASAGSLPQGGPGAASAGSLPQGGPSAASAGSLPQGGQGGLGAASAGSGAVGPDAASAGPGAAGLGAASSAPGAAAVPGGANALQKRIIPTFGQIEQIVNNGIEAGKEVHTARAQAGLPDGPPSRPPLRQPLGGSQGVEPGTSTSPLAGLSAANPGTSSAALSSLTSQLSRRDHPTNQFELHMQVMNLVSAAIKTSDEIRSITASPDHHNHLHRRTPNWPMFSTSNNAKEASHHLQQRSPLGAMGGAGIAVEIIQALMPVILAGIEEVGKLGSQWIQSQQQEHLAEAEHNATLTAQAQAHGSSSSVGAGSGAAGSGTGSSSAAGSAGLSGKTKRDVVGSAQGSGGQCSGTAELCLEVIESTFPHCRHNQPPGSVQSSTGSKTHYRGAAELVRAMTLHCTLKCVGFTHLIEGRTNFEEEAEKCAGDPQLFNNIHSIESLLHQSRSQKDPQSADASRGTTLSKRSPPPKCRSAYQPTFVNAMRPVATYSNKLFGSVISDPSSFLHWGLVHTLSECLHACDQTDGCVFVNLYQQSFGLETPVKLINRSNGAEGGDRRKVFARKPDGKKNSFVQGHLTCALYSRCFSECDAEYRSDAADPVFFERSSGWCKSKACLKGDGGGAV